MRVAILGDGLLGRSLVDVMAGRDDYTVSLLGHADIEITDKASVQRALADCDVAINTIAFHRFAACEADPMMARLVNTEGARYVAETLPTVYVSSDYVFNGGGPHEETLPGEDPRSVYGRTKLAGELATLAAGGVVVRVAGLFGHHASHKGPSFPEMVTSSFDTLKLPVDQRISPTYAPDAAARIAGLARDLADPEYLCPNCVTPWKCNGPHKSVTGIYHAANAGSTSWAEWAEQIIEATPWRRTVIPYTAHDRLRPTDSSLKSKRLPPLPHWRVALDRWAEQRRKELYVVSPKRSEA